MTPKLKLIWFVVTKYYCYVFSFLFGCIACGFAGVALLRPSAANVAACVLFAAIAAGCVWGSLVCAKIEKKLRISVTPHSTPKPR